MFGCLFFVILSNDISVKAAFLHTAISCVNWLSSIEKKIGSDTNKIKALKYFIIVELAISLLGILSKKV